MNLLKPIFSSLVGLSLTKCVTSENNRVYYSPCVQPVRGPNTQTGNETTETPRTEKKEIQAS